MNRPLFPTTLSIPSYDMGGWAKDLPAHPGIVALTFANKKLSLCSSEVTLLFHSRAIMCWSGSMEITTEGFEIKVPI